MIHQREELFQRISNHQFDSGCPDIPYEKKLEALETAVDIAVRTGCKTLLKDGPAVHLAYSGGVDSSLILVKVLQQGFPLFAHTICSSTDHPDAQHALKFVGLLSRKNRNVELAIHTLAMSRSAIDQSNEILGKKMERADNYYMLMRVISRFTKRIICCDCIDELMGGYYAHRDPQQLPIYDAQKSIDENRKKALKYFMSHLIPDHLSILEACSAHFGVEVVLPYGSELVMDCTAMFTASELVDENSRKKPVYDLARKNGVSEDILQRRKRGLVNALEQV